MQLTNMNRFIAEASANYTNESRHVAPQLKSFDTSLYPFVKHGKLDVAGGHHDAGDYSKYTINSAALIHVLVFAVDALPGLGALDRTIHSVPMEALGSPDAAATLARRCRA